MLFERNSSFASVTRRKVFDLLICASAFRIMYYYVIRSFASIWLSPIAIFFFYRYVHDRSTLSTENQWAFRELMSSFIRSYVRALSAHQKTHNRSVPSFWYYSNGTLYPFRIHLSPDWCVGYLSENFEPTATGNQNIRTPIMFDLQLTAVKPRSEIKKHKNYSKWPSGSLISMQQQFDECDRFGMNFEWWSWWRFKQVLIVVFLCISSSCEKSEETSKKHDKTMSMLNAKCQSIYSLHCFSFVYGRMRFVISGACMCVCLLIDAYAHMKWTLLFTIFILEF